MWFGLHFVPQPDPYTAEYIAISIIYMLWAVSYWFQFKISTTKKIILFNFAVIILVVLYIFFIYYPISFLEYFLE